MVCHTLKSCWLYIHSNDKLEIKMASLHYIQVNKNPKREYRDGTETRPGAHNVYKASVGITERF